MRSRVEGRAQAAVRLEVVLHLRQGQDRTHREEGHRPIGVGAQRRAGQPTQPKLHKELLEVCRKDGLRVGLLTERSRPRLARHGPGPDQERQRGDGECDRRHEAADGHLRQTGAESSTGTVASRADSGMSSRSVLNRITTWYSPGGRAETSYAKRRWYSR